MFYKILPIVLIIFFLICIIVGIGYQSKFIRYDITMNDGSVLRVSWYSIKSNQLTYVENGVKYFISLDDVLSIQEVDIR